jgi:hypothetical protein
MSRPEDQRPLPDGDFRAIRAYLADDVFASVPGGGAVPNDPLGQSEWEHLMDLPTDVLLRTTDYLGMMIDDVVTQRSAWTAAMPDDPSQVPFMFDAALDAGDEFQAAPFIASHGYYRQATAALRNALEVMAHAARFAVRNDQRGYQGWRAGSDEPKFGNSVDLLGQDKVLAAAEQNIGAPGLFGRKPDGVLRTLYADLCRYAHSKPGYSNADIWQSNGPVFIGRAFTQFWQDFCDTVAVSYVLFKIGYPALILPRVVRSIYGAAGPAWHGLAESVEAQFFPQ